MLPFADRVKIVLVNTSAAGNIGSCARAMKTMGLNQLVLVQPDNYPTPEAEWMAANAKDVLEQAVVVSTVEEAIADCSLVIGTSARQRRLPWPLQDSRSMAGKVLEEVGRGQVAILFGREERGLTNEELQMCQLHVCIPSNPDYGVLNIAQAAQIICYELRMAWEQAQADTLVGLAPDAIWDEPWATATEVEGFHEHLERFLVQLGFLDPAQPRQLMPRLRRLFARARMDRMEPSSAC